MSNKKVIIGSLATVVAAGTIGVNVTNAYLSKNSTKRETTRDAIEKMDFTAFQDVIKDGARLSSVDTEAEFEAIKRAYKLRSESKYEEATMVLHDAGIEADAVSSGDVRVSVRDAIQNGDWIEFQEATDNKKFGALIDTREKFELLIEAYELQKDGRKDEAQDIMNVLGVRQIV